MLIKPARRTLDIQYAVRDIVLVAEQAQKLGKDLIYLNIGDPNHFDFQTPPHLVEATCKAMQDNRNAYAPSEGIPEAREAIRRQALQNGFDPIDIFITTGASEAIDITFAALFEEGDEVLLPMPVYPFYTAVCTKQGIRVKSYYLDESQGWLPNPSEIEAQITPKTKAIVIINPNNPTGAVYPPKILEALAELALKHHLLVFADEIYDKLILDPEWSHLSIASISKDLPVVTFNGLSKAYLGPGLRMGWGMISGPSSALKDYIEAVHKLLRARLCANHPLQYAIAPALEGPQDHLLVMKQKLRARRDITVSMLNQMPGVHCVPPRAAFYAFPSIALNQGRNDLQLIKKMVLETGVVVVPGQGFGQKPQTHHFRVVFLPPEPLLQKAYRRMHDFILKSLSL